MVVVAIGILATLVVPAYQNFIEDQQARVDETNLKALQSALDTYTMEHDTMPASLSRLPREYINRGYAQALQQEDAWKMKLAYAVVDWQNRSLAYAAFLRDSIARGDMRLLTCPKDPAPSADHGSYGLNIKLEGITAVAYRNLPADTILIAESINATFNDANLVTDLVMRHQHHGILSSTNYAHVIRKNKSIWEIDQVGNSKEKVHGQGNARNVPAKVLGVEDEDKDKDKDKDKGKGKP